MNQIEDIQKEFQIDKEKLDNADIKEKYLGKQGLLTIALQEIRNIPDEQRAEYGKKVNDLKNEILETQNVEQQKTYSNKERIDPTAPFDINTKGEKRNRISLISKGAVHPITKEVETLVEIFKGMGFDVLESRQIDDDYHMFESVNFPKGHPARDMYDTFLTEDGYVLPAHTSTMQNRALKLFGPPPIAVVLPGRCFRNEATDAGHEHTFHQIEGVYVDKDISLGNMLATIKTYLEAYLEKELEVKVQPAYFPFTEPDCEFVISCPFCDKAGCKTCGYSGWIEIMGCGMIHPNVLREGGIDPDIYTGFAWGFGVDRLTMIKKGIKDIRHLRDSNLNFLEQF